MQVRYNTIANISAIFNKKLTHFCHREVILASNTAIYINNQRFFVGGHTHDHIQRLAAMRGGQRLRRPPSGIRLRYRDRSFLRKNMRNYCTWREQDLLVRLLRESAHPVGVHKQDRRRHYTRVGKRISKMPRREAQKEEMG